MNLEDALNALYQGRTNVAVMAKSINMDKTELQQVFRDYVRDRPIDADIWERDVEPSWPYVT